MSRAGAPIGLAIAVLAAGALRGDAESLPIHSVERKDGTVVVRSREVVVLQYQIERPADSRLSVESGCYDFFGGMLIFRRSGP